MADPIQGTSSGDVIFDTAGDDKLLGHSGDDLFFLSVGNDTVNGQGGFDTALSSTGDQLILHRNHAGRINEIALRSAGRETTWQRAE